MNDKSSIPSPCVGVCQLDKVAGHCMGCWRTPAQISQWSLLDNAGRMQIIAELKQKRTAAGLRREKPSKRGRAQGDWHVRCR